MKISEFSVKHSLLVNLISVFILIAGFYTLFIYKIQREAFPEVSYDMVVVNTVYPGAPPQEVEKLVTIPIEKELKGVVGTEEILSTSLENSSNILIKISQDVKDKDKVVDDIKRAVDRVRNLPNEIDDDPIVTEITSGEMPVIQVSLSGGLSEIVLQQYAEELEDILEDIPGVSSISRGGFRNQEVWVEVDPDKMRDAYVSIEEIMAALKGKNISIPGGKLRGEEESNIRVVGEFQSKNEIEDVIIRANEAGNWLRVKDVASVRFTFADEDVINKSYGTRSIDLIVVKRTTGDTIRIVEQVKKNANTFLRNADSDLKISFINDISYYIKRRLGVLKNNSIIGLLLVFCVLVLFLNFRIAFITALGLPIAFCATLAIMAFLGLSVNLITMFGLIIVLGMLVDDGIIIAENCSRYLENGLSPKEAAIAGTQEVVKPVTTTILTTIAAFAPLLFMKGMLGKFIWGIPLVVIIALGASLFEALVILPSHFSNFVRVKKEFHSKRQMHWFNKVTNFYTRLLEKALNRRYRVFGGLLVIFILTILLASRMPFILFGSEEGVEQFYIRMEAPVGTNLYITEKLTQKIEERVAKLPTSEMESYITKIGSMAEGWMFDPYSKSGSHVSQITVHLRPYAKRKRKVREIMESLRVDIGDAEGFNKIYFDKPQAGPPVGKPVAVKIRGEDFIFLEKISKEIISFLEGIEGVSDIASDYELGRGEIRVIINENKAAMAFLSVQEIAASIRHAFKGGIATSIKPVKAEEEIDVIVRLPEELRSSRDSFAKIFIPNKFGNLIPLEKVARLEKKVSSSRIQHQDGKRVITVRADVDNKKTTSLKVNNILEKEFRDISSRYSGYGIEYGGEQEENRRSGKNFLGAFALAAFFIFLILAANFNSLIQPIIVMMAIPFGLIGVIIAFFLHGLSLSFFMMMGVVGLTGIVVNDSIVLVEFINGLRRKGEDRRESIIKAGQLRLRPVLLTTITTALGLTPTAYGIWGGDPFLKPMALTIVWGIICATVLTLIVLPCIYSIIDDFALKFLGHGTVSGKDDE